MFFHHFIHLFIGHGHDPGHWRITPSPLNLVTVKFLYLQSKSTIMKRILYCLLPVFFFVITITALIAQTVNQGAWMIGGTAGFSSTKVKDQDATTSLNLSPNLGIYIIDDLAIGANISFLSTSANGNTNSSFGLGPFVRYYVADPIFIQAGVDLGFEDDDATVFGASVGYSWFLDNSLAVEPALFFKFENYKNDAADATKFGLSIGVQAFPGRN